MCSCMGSVSVFVMQMLYDCVLCASCGSSQFCVLHDSQFVNAGRGCKRRPYGRDILQSWSHKCLVGSHECLLLFSHPVAVTTFMICRGLCVLYTRFRSKVRPRTFGCVAMGNAFVVYFLVPDCSYILQGLA